MTCLIVSVSSVKAKSVNMIMVNDGGTKSVEMILASLSVHCKTVILLIPTVSGNPFILMRLDSGLSEKQCQRILQE